MRDPNRPFAVNTGMDSNDSIFNLNDTSLYNRMWGIQ